MTRTLLSRLVLVLCGLAALTTGLALAFQDRALSRDLEGSAQKRLETAAVAARLLLDGHMQTVRERYVAISGTPQFRANIEVDDPPTLLHYATTLLEANEATFVAFLDPTDREVVRLGDDGLAAEARRTRRTAVSARDGVLYLMISVPLQTGGRRVGRLVVGERIEDELLAHWSTLAGAEVELAPKAKQPQDGIQLLVRPVDDLALRVRTSLAAEQEALARSRGNLASAGLLAVAFAFGASLFLARSLVGPIAQITDAAKRIGAGELSVSIGVERADELGQLSTALEEMADQLDRKQAGLREANVELRQVNAELGTARDAAEAATRAKSEFLANVSHEIRTPMTAILGFADLVVEQKARKNVRDGWAQAIRMHGEHLLTLVEDVLDFSTLGTDRLAADPSECALGEIVSEAVRTSSAGARERGLALRTETAGPLPTTIRTDPARLLRVLNHLLRNAIKFTDAGEVVLRVSLPADRLEFAIRDGGIGIAAVDLDRIFEPFVQVDASSKRRFGGMGLGLAICRHSARLLGGDLSVESTPGHGSCFRLAIDPGPLDGVATTRATAADRDEREVAGSVPPAQLRGRVLVADDGRDNRVLLSGILRKAGLSVELAEDGEDSIAKVAAARESGETFDVILMDMQMPNVDGYDATRRLRNAGYAGPIVALTAHAIEGERKRCLDAGCDDFATKPIHRLSLLRLIARFLDKRTAQD